ncbi:MAG: hypothetical protein IPO69_17385 [Saprospiraceae bacterium]|nr:hypothetical protein [Saprospiraceae bacterium]
MVARIWKNRCCGHLLTDPTDFVQDLHGVDDDYTIQHTADGKRMVNIGC